MFQLSHIAVGPRASRITEDIFVVRSAPDPRGFLSRSQGPSHQNLAKTQLGYVGRNRTARAWKAHGFRHAPSSLSPLLGETDIHFLLSVFGPSLAEDEAADSLSLSLKITLRLRVPLYGPCPVGALKCHRLLALAPDPHNAMNDYFDHENRWSNIYALGQPVVHLI